MKSIFFAVFAILLSCFTVSAQDSAIQPLLQNNQALIAKSSRKTIGPVIDAIAASGLSQAQSVLETWAAKDMWQRKSDGLFFKGEAAEGGQIRLTDFDNVESVSTVAKSDLKQLKPNSGVRALIGTALVRFQLMDPNKAKRQEALTSIGRDPEAGLLAPLRASIETEEDAGLKAQKQRLERLLTIGYDTDPAARIAAIALMSGDLGVDLRGTLNPIVATTRNVALGAVPEGINIAKILRPDDADFSAEQAYDLLVGNGLAPPRITNAAIRSALSANIDVGRVAGFPLAQLDTDDTRRLAYQALAEAGKAPPFVTDTQVSLALAKHVFFDSYADPSPR